MTTKEQIKQYINSLPEQKAAEVEQLHKQMLKTHPKIKLWFDDGRNESGKVVANPTIGYGQFTIKYANGETKEFFQIGFSANTTGISVYILGIKDKAYLNKTYGIKLGKAKVTGYCIKFKALKDIDIDVLKDAIEFGIAHTKV